MDTSPAVSVLMPVYNGGRFLAPALDSVLAQTFSDFEVIAIDDGSSDGSTEVLRRYAARDPRVRVVSQENEGIVASLNRALALARAPLVARMDADDISRPDRFAKQLAYLQHNVDVAAVSSAIDVIDESDGYLRTDVFPSLPEAVASELMFRSCVCHPAVMARTEVLRALGGYRAIVQYAEDYDLWLRIAERASIANLPDVLLAYREHPIRISTRNIVAQELAALAARGAARLRRSGKPDPLALFDAGAQLRYSSLQHMLEGAMTRAEFAFSLFRAVLSRAAELDSLAEWAKLYLRYGLRDLDQEGTAIMILYLGHVMRRRRRGGASLIALLPYPFWALVTAIRRPTVAWRLAFNPRYWLERAHVRLREPNVVSTPIQRTSRIGAFHGTKDAP
jgi:glycosyltransferase involved in cell wall biosynthesis